MKSILCYGDSNTYGLRSDLISRYSREQSWSFSIRGGSSFLGYYFGTWFFKMQTL